LPAEGKLNLQYFTCQKDPGRSPLCHFREYLTNSGHLQLIASHRPLGFSSLGRPLTRLNPNYPLRFFLFSKLMITQTNCMTAAEGEGRPRRTRAGKEGEGAKGQQQQTKWRQIARQILLDKIEATED
jgi:hypothetical protein